MTALAALAALAAIPTRPAVANAVRTLRLIAGGNRSTAEAAYDPSVASNWSDSRTSPVFLQCGHEGWRRFSGPVRTIRAESAAEVLPALGEIESATQKGLYAAGFLTYEAASAFDGALVTRPAGALPLLWFGIYERCEFVELPLPLRPPDRSRSGDAPGSRPRTSQG